MAAFAEWWRLGSATEAPFEVAVASVVVPYVIVSGFLPRIIGLWSPLRAWRSRGFDG